MDLLLILVVILVIVLVIRGPKTLPKLGEALGRTVKDTRDEFARKSDDPTPPGSQPPAA
ncbi:MAG: twin-arginine translocase TatA/TatE family subunit [Chloroflexota bacterium]